MARDDVNFKYDLAARKRLAVKLVNDLPEDLEPYEQIEVLRLAIRLVETFMVDDSGERPTVKVVPMPPRS